MDWNSVVQAVLFAIFSVLTEAVNVVIGPAYETLFVPEMAPSSAYAPYLLHADTGSLFYRGAEMSEFVLVNIVDPVAILVIITVGLLYLLRATLPEKAYSWTNLAPRLVIGVLLSNAVLPLTWMLWEVAATVYLPIYSYGGGAWQTYANIVPMGGLNFAWDNGMIAFIASMVLLSLVLTLAFLLAFRDALLAVLLVLLPAVTLLWPIPPLAGLAKRAWWLFAEMTFLPTLVVIPLALAVGSGSVLLVIGLFAAAAGMPLLLSQAGGNLSSAGFPHTGSITTGGVANGYDKAGRAAGTSLRAGGQGFSSGKGAVSGGASAGGKAAGSSFAGSGATAGAVGGPAGTAAGIMWGVGYGMGRFAKQMMARTTEPKEGRSRPPAPLPRSHQIGAQ